MAKNCQWAGEIHNVANIQIGTKSGPLESGDFGKDAVKPVISKSGN